MIIILYIIVSIEINSVFLIGLSIPMFIDISIIQNQQLSCKQLNPQAKHSTSLKCHSLAELELFLNNRRESLSRMSTELL